MMETFKIIKGIYDTAVTEGLLPLQESSMRGHNYNIFKHNCRSWLDIRKYYFGLRINDQWNNLPVEVVNAKTVNSFEKKWFYYGKTVM